MRTDFPLFPDSASTMSPHVDLLYFALLAICGIVSLMVVVLILVFAIKYRRRPGHEVAIEYEPYLWVEWSWIIIPFFIFMGMFLWGAHVYFRMSRVPDDSLDVYVTGKQWMWKFQHIGGQSEINELHVPVGRPVKLTLASEDVIHSLYFPAFRVKNDVIPARYSILWFQATKLGTYHINCTEYCGTWHSRMIGRVQVMTPSDYQNWLSGGGPERSPAQAGEQLFQQFACNTCHTQDATARGPVLAGLFGTMVRLTTGQTVRVDENYIRESIMNPGAKVVEGYQPIMPTYQAQLDEQKLMHLLAYIKSLSPPALPDAGTRGRGDAGTNPLPDAAPRRHGDAAMENSPSLRPSASPLAGKVETPRRRVAASPRPGGGGSPRPRVSASPRPGGGGSPRPRVSASPRPGGGGSPRRRVAASPRLVQEQQ